MKTPGSWLAVVVGIATLGFASWFLVRPRAVEEAPPRPPFVLPVTLAKVESGTLRPHASLSGDVRAARRASLAFEVSGTVREVLAEEAGAVEKGEVLARLDSEDEELELVSATAARSLAQRQHDLLLAGERPEEKRRLEAVLDSAKAEEELARSEVKRGEQLLESRVLSESEQDRRVSVLRVAEKRRVAAEEELSRALAGTRAEDLAIAAARIDETEARVATARHELDKTILRAPWAGRVVRRLVSVGDFVQSGTPVYELIDLDHLEIHLDVPARLSGRLGAETTARVRLPGPGQRVLTTPLDAIVPAADAAARSFRAILRLEPADDGASELRPGQFLDVELLLEPLDGVLLVPTDCLLAGDGRFTVVRAVEGGAGMGGQPGLKADFVPVEVLAEESGTSAVQSAPGVERPLAAGDLLVLTGADSAFPGADLMPPPPAGAGGPGGAGGPPGAGGAPGGDEAE